MRLCRYLWLLVLAVALPALGETIPATLKTPDMVPGYQSYAGSWKSPWRATGEEACADYKTYSGYGPGTYQVLNGQAACWANSSAYFSSVTVSPRAGCFVSGAFTTNCVAQYSCPDSTWTLNGQTCEKQACPEGYSFVYGKCRKDCQFLQTRSEENPECHCADNVSMRNNVGVWTEGAGSIPDVVCTGGCTFKIGEAIGGGGQWWWGQRSEATYQICTGSDNQNATPPENKEPPCGASEGVLTTSTGAVRCVPAGTPDARKPDVEIKKKKETFPDGSQAETKKTTTKDPATGNQHEQEVRNATGGQSGTSGTSTSTTETSDNKDGGSNPGACTGDNCGGGDDGDGFDGPDIDGLYEKGERTIRQVIDDFIGQVQGAPVIAAARNWLTVSGMSGSCGGMSASIPMINETISLDEYICGQGAQLALSIAGIVVLALAAFAGWRIAFL